MLNRHTCSSQFFITLVPCQHLTGKHTLFGRVVGPTSMSVIETISRTQVDSKDRPLTAIEVVHCGELELRKKVVPQEQQAEASTSKSGRKRSASVSSNASSRSDRSVSSSSSTRSDESEHTRKKRKKAAKKARKEEKKAAKKARKEEKKKRKREEALRSPSPATKLRLEEAKVEQERLDAIEKLRREEEEFEAREAKIRELERLKREDAEERKRRGSSETNGGDEVVYKGRGMMKYNQNGRSGMRTANW